MHTEDGATARSEGSEVPLPAGWHYRDRRSGTRTDSALVLAFFALWAAFLIVPGVWAIGVAFRWWAPWW